MRSDERKLLGILRIGHAVSVRGEGLSVRDALVRSDYEGLRREFGASNLVPLLRRHPNLVRQWVRYSEDKRTSGGFWISEDPLEVGSLASPEATIHFDSLEEAVAAFVVCELDYWSAVGSCRPVQ
jgi:hypothetical protein